MLSIDLLTNNLSILQQIRDQSSNESSML